MKRDWKEDSKRDEVESRRNKKAIGELAMMMIMILMTFVMRQY